MRKIISLENNKAHLSFRSQSAFASLLCGILVLIMAQAPSTLPLLAAPGGFSGRARLEARLDGTAPAAEMPFTSKPASAMMKDGRDFAGLYYEENVTDLGETYYVSVNFQIFNYSDANVSGATVCLLDRLTNDSTWSSTGVSIADRQGVVLEGDVTVPRREYEYWQKGGTPYLFIEYRNAQGDEVRRTIELVRKPTGEMQ